MGVGAFISDLMMSPETIASTYPADQVEFLKTYPAWTKIFYGIATIGGLLGCVGLLLRKKWSLMFLLISLFGVIVQQAHSVFMTDAVEVFGASTAIYFPLLIFVTSLILVWFAKNSISKGYLT